MTTHGGFFAGGWKGFLFALCIVVASYQGLNWWASPPGKQNPQVTLKRAINNILWRILIFYVGAIFVIVTIFPWNGIGTTGSPFVLTFAKIGIAAAAGIINFVVLTAALSGYNSGMYSGGRVCCTPGQEPPTAGGVDRFPPAACGERIAVTIGLLVGSALNYIIPNPEQVFVYVYSASVLRAWCRGSWC